VDKDLTQLGDQNVLRDLGAGYRLFGKNCFTCTFIGGLFAVQGQSVEVCPCYVQARIDRIDLELGGLPGDIETLCREAIQEARYQRWREKMALSVDWNYLWKCHRCKHLMQRFEVRLIPAEEKAPVTHHKICYACYLVYCAEEKSRTGTHPWRRPQGADRAILMGLLRPRCPGSEEDG